MQHGDSESAHANAKDDRAISEVQRAEEDSVRVIEAANAEKQKAISDARKKAEEIVERAISGAKEKRQKAVSEAMKELDKEKEIALKGAEKEASIIRARKLSGHSKERILDELVSLILGA